jgi:hypothetical protein
VEIDFNMVTTDRRITHYLNIAVLIASNVKSIGKRKVRAVSLAPIDPNIDSIHGGSRSFVRITFSHLATFPRYWFVPNTMEGASNPPLHDQTYCRAVQFPAA